MAPKQQQRHTSASTSRTTGARATGVLEWRFTNKMMNVRDLSRDDDFLSHLLVEKLGTGDVPLLVHKMDSSRALPKTDAAVLMNIVRRLVVAKGPLQHVVREAVNELLRLPAVLYYLKSYTQQQINAFATHAARYFELYHPSGCIEIAHTSRYSLYTGKSELCILATRDLAPGAVISELKGSMANLTEDEDRALKETQINSAIRRDFSVIHSRQMKKNHLFLGPARFVNHDCDHNCELFREGKYITFRVIKPIKLGQEVTAHYGDSYFGKGNKHCLCETCEKNGRGGYDPANQGDDAGSSSDGSDVSDVESVEEAPVNVNERRTRRGVYATTVPEVEAISSDSEEEEDNTNRPLANAAPGAIEVVAVGDSDLTPIPSDSEPAGSTQQPVAGPSNSRAPPAVPPPTGAVEGSPVGSPLTVVDEMSSPKLPSPKQSTISPQQPFRSIIATRRQKMLGIGAEASASVTVPPTTQLASPALTEDATSSISTAGFNRTPTTTRTTRTSARKQAEANGKESVSKGKGPEAKAKAAGKGKEPEAKGKEAAGKVKEVDGTNKPPAKSSKPGTVAQSEPPQQEPAKDDTPKQPVRFSTRLKGKGKGKEVSASPVTIASAKNGSHSPTKAKVKKEDAEVVPAKRGRPSLADLAAREPPPKVPEVPRGPDGKPLPLCATCKSVLPVICVDYQPVWGQDLDSATRQGKQECPRCMRHQAIYGQPWPRRAPLHGQPVEFLPTPRSTTPEPAHAKRVTARALPMLDKKLQAAAAARSAQREETDDEDGRPAKKRRVDDSASAGPNAVPVPKRRGRPPKNPPAATAPPPATALPPVELKQEENADSTVPLKRKRGRPPKNPALRAAQLAAAASAPVGQPMKSEPQPRTLGGQFDRKHRELPKTTPKSRAQRAEDRERVRKDMERRGVVPTAVGDSSDEEVTEIDGVRWKGKQRQDAQAAFSESVSAGRMRGQPGSGLRDAPRKRKLVDASDLGSAPHPPPPPPGRRRVEEAGGARMVVAATGNAGFSGGRLWRASPAGYARNFVDVGEFEVEEILPPASASARVLQTIEDSPEPQARPSKVYVDAAVGSDNEMTDQSDSEESEILTGYRYDYPRVPIPSTPVPLKCFYPTHARDDPHYESAVWESSPLSDKE
ncbi:uncharacterized protein SCHCODRAFT_02631999 [Schizophyllum commune H4-8]|uniref:uncharacterized protein n=1 Tax=Schizophyllum commune (strain H4-8 / FGSC 9210) TaxID=578458 RepID=UPI00215F3D20|nr:uncharacterized protein SCHCODRAFT_02631999 [Schizophyllum commune H4-8]KAI5890490.1 hypothetical protein SCHCODRAFT_02631999 [Schizophyllum commune H4-8]